MAGRRIIRPRSIDDFCERHGFCRSFFYKYLNEMPAVTKIGNRVFILEKDEAAWVEKQQDNQLAQHEAA